MKKKGKMMLCLVILVVLLGILILVRWINREEESDDTAETAGVEVTDAEEDKVTGFSFQIDGQEVSFTKTDDTWTYDQDTEFPLNQTSVGTAVGKIIQLSAEQELEDHSLNLSDYGLDTPTNVVTFTDDSGTTKLTIGNENATTGIWYLYLNDDTGKIYLVDQSFDTMFPDSIMSWAEGETLPSITADNITKIQVENGDDDYQLTAEAEDETASWTVTDASGFSHEGDAEQISTLTSTLSSLSYAGMEAYNCEDMAQYGLAEPAAAVRVHYTEEQTADDSEEETTVTVEKDLVLLIGSQNEEGNYYVTTEGSKEVHTMTESTVSSILDVSASDYWSLSVSPVTVTEIRSMDVTYNGQTNTIVRNTSETTDEDGDTTQTITYTWNGNEVDKTEASTLYSAAVSMTAQSKAPDLEKNSEDELVLVMHTDDGDYTVSFSPYDSSFYYTVDLEGVPSLVNKNNVSSLIDAYLTVIGEK